MAHLTEDFIEARIFANRPVVREAFAHLLSEAVHFETSQDAFEDFKLVDWQFVDQLLQHSPLLLRRDAGFVVHGAKQIGLALRSIDTRKMKGRSRMALKVKGTLG